jgi:hypothetical protein
MNIFEAAYQGNLREPERNIKTGINCEESYT